MIARNKGAIKLLSIILGIIILILIAQGFYYLHLRRIQKDDELTQDYQQIPTEIDECDIEAYVEEIYSQGPVNQVRLSGGADFITVEGVVTDLKENQLTIIRDGKEYFLLRSDITFIKIVDWEENEIGNEMSFTPTSYEEIENGQVVSFNPEHGRLIINKVSGNIFLENEN